MPCPGENTLLAWIEAGQGAGVVAEHLDGCPDCRALLGALGGGSQTELREASRYRIERCLGEGGMGLVFEAFDPILRRKVALKMIRLGADEAATAELHARLQREAALLARLRHPNVVQVFDAGVSEGEAFLVMELVEGMPLHDWQRGRLWTEVLDSYLQAGAGLAAAHAQGLVHRDFKPANVLVGHDGRVRVSDFGLARVLDDPDDLPLAEPAQAKALAPLTVAGRVMGSPSYMSPEQMQARPADARSDVFSFAVSLYEALFGERPYPGASLRELRESVLAGALREPPAASPALFLRPALLRGLAVDPNDRIALPELLDELKRERALRQLEGARELLEQAAELAAPGATSKVFVRVALDVLLDLIESSHGTPASSARRWRLPPTADAGHLTPDCLPIRWAQNPLLHRASVRAPAARALLTGFGEFQALAWHFLQREGLGTGGELPADDRLLPMAPFLRVLGRVEREVGPEVLFKVGASLPDHFLPNPGSARDVLGALDIEYHAAHGLDGEPLCPEGTILRRGIGGYHVSERDGVLAVRCDNPYPCMLDFGLVSRIATLGTAGTVTHVEGSCRRKGDEACAYQVTF